MSQTITITASDSRSLLESPISSVPTTRLDVKQIASLCRPVFEKVQTRCNTLHWAGVFGSVSRGTQRPDSDIDIIIGHTPNSDYLQNLGGTMCELMNALPEALGRDVDIIHVIRGTPFSYVHMEALLTCKTLYGDPSWADDNREVAERSLRDGYKRLKKAASVASDVFARLPSSEEELASPENKSLRLFILSEALLLVDLVEMPAMHPFYSTMVRTLGWLSTHKQAIRGCTDENELMFRQNLQIVWLALSNNVNRTTIKAMVEMVEQTFERAGLQLPRDAGK